MAMRRFPIAARVWEIVGQKRGGAGGAVSWGHEVQPGDCAMAEGMLRRNPPRLVM
jgi:hypothetical protein